MHSHHREVQHYIPPSFLHLFLFDGKQVSVCLSVCLSEECIRPGIKMGVFCDVTRFKLTDYYCFGEIRFLRNDVNDVSGYKTSEPSSFQIHHK
jgi:hypothetical protein